LIARKIAIDFSFLAVNRDFDKARIVNEVESPFRAFFALALRLSCVVVMYRKLRRAKFSPNKNGEEKIEFYTLKRFKVCRRRRPSSVVVCTY
jgi:hypothetical protein